MADQPISTLTLYATYHTDDEVEVLDVHDVTFAASGTNKRVTFSSLISLAGIVQTTGGYADPAWITSLAGAKISGNITGSAANVTGTVAIANGGTGQITAAAGFNALSPVTTLGDLIYGSAANTAARLAGNTSSAKQLLTQTGTGAVSAAPAWGVLVAGDIPTIAESQVTNLTADLAAKATDTLVVHLAGIETITGAKTFSATITGSITGTASNVTGTVAIANGGTGQITAAAGFNALSPLTTLGDILYASAANTAARLAGNTTAAKQLLTQTGTGAVSAAPAWGVLVAGDIPTIAESQVTNLTADLAAKATDTLVVHLAGTETVTGTKTFSATIAGSITGTAANVTGTVAIANGGTGQITAAAAFGALSPIATLGDLLYGGTAGADTILPGNTVATQKFLAQTGTGTVSAAPSWITITGGVAVDVQTFTASGTWTKPAGVTFTRFVGIGGGGGGSSGSRRASGTAGGGGGGGGGAAISDITYRCVDLAASIAVTIGAGGSGGAGQTVDNNTGNNGASGGDTTIGSVFTSAHGFGAIGSGGGSGGTGGSGMFGGGPGGSGSGGAGLAGPTLGFNAVGGGGGGAVSVTPAAFAGGAGGSNNALGFVSGGSGGIAGGGVGAVGSAAGAISLAAMPGTGGGGGGASITIAGGTGGAGGGYGSGGGGGGASLNGSNSGAGGNGAPGFVIALSW